MWRGGFRSSRSVAAPFVWRCLRADHDSVSTSRSSNRTCGFPASGSRTRTSRLRPRRRRAQAGPDGRARSARKGARVDRFPPWRRLTLCLTRNHRRSRIARVVVDRPIRFADGPYCRSSSPSRAACRFNCSTSSVVSCQLPDRTVSAWTFSTMRLMLFFDGRVPKIGFAGSSASTSAERIAQEIELLFRHPAESCLLLVDRELQFCP